MPADHLFNQVIAALSQGNQPPWIGQLEQVELPARHELHSQGEATPHIHFPTSALVVLIHSVDAEGEAPVALVGNDGLVGAAALLGTGPETHRAVVLHPGSAWRLPTSAVPSDGPDAAPLVQAAVGHLMALTSQMAQTAYCQRYHPVEQRLARWLLTALDRLPGNAVSIDLGELADVLAVSADAMAGAAAQLVSAGALVCEPKRLVMTSRAVLHARSCGCHAPDRGGDRGSSLTPT